MKKKIVIIGGCAAGPKCAAKSRRMDADTDISIYTKSSYISYSACGLPYFLGGQVKNVEQLIIRTPEDFKKVGINVYTDHGCTKINPDKKTVVINEKTISYDELVIATGASAIIPKIPNIGLKNIFHLRVLEDGKNIKAKMKDAKQVLIIGAGYIAIELVEAFTRNDIFVTVIEQAAHAMPNFDPEISELIEQRVVNQSTPNVKLYTSDTVVEFIEENGEFRGAKTKNGLEIFADFCVIATGVRPNAMLAKEAGIEIGPTGAIRVNRHMKTSIPHIWAVGDCTEKFCMITKEPRYVALGSIANKEGRVCAINLNGGHEEFEGILGSAVTRYHDYTISITGLTEQSANTYPGILPVSSIITDSDKAGYMPGMEEITIKLVGSKRSRRIVGAQVVGKGDADKRVNAVMAAIQMRMSIEEFLSLDLTYSPAYSTAIDPLLAAAAKLKDKMNA